MKLFLFLLGFIPASLLFAQAPSTSVINFFTNSPVFSASEQIQNVVVDNGGGIDFSSFDLDPLTAGFQQSFSIGNLVLSYDIPTSTLNYTYTGSGCNGDGFSLEYVISDNFGNISSSSFINMTVAQFAFPPNSVDDFYTINQSDTLIFDPFQNDAPIQGFCPIPGQISFFNTTPNANTWSQSFSPLSIEFISDADFTGIATALYTTTNMCGVSNVGLITINVLPTPGPTSGIYGRVFRDENVNCLIDNNEAGVENVLLAIQPGNIVVQTNPNGYWIADTLIDGDYEVTAVLPNNLWESGCNLVQNITILNGNIVTPLFIGLNYIQDCSQPSVSISMPVIRRCFSNQSVFVSACNESTATGMLENAFTEIELDPLLLVSGSTLSFTNLGNNKFRFDLGNIGIGQCSNFVINTTVSCDATLNQTLCLEANLFPVESCVTDTVIENPTFPTGVTPCALPWDRSSLSVDGWCANDSIYFTITNTGELGNGDMDCYSPVRIYIDGQMYQFDSIMIQGGQTVTYAFAGTGQTWRLEADQHPLHPGHSRPNASVEMCGDDANWTPGLVTILPQDDAEPVKDIYCGMVTGSYDPNDKQGFPLGLGANHDIMPNQDLEYMIRFQNTGTDTAFTVVIRDTLDMDLDIFSVVAGVSSHNYTFTMQGPRVLEWTFTNIMLPDSTTNLDASNGFVTFTVNQNVDLVNGTQITNTADIYFDFNAPITTNQTIHTINSCIQNSTISSIQVTACDTYTAPDGQVYNTSGIYTAIIPNSVACDSTITIDLTINNSSASSLTQVSCDMYTAPDGQMYMASGTYTAIIPNMMGCDSTITIDLTINQTSSSAISAVICQSYTAPDGQVYTQAGTYTAVIPNMMGCDSTITITLTTNNTTSSTIEATTCDPYTAPDGQIYNLSGTYTAIIPNAVGCDSIITINLTTSNSTNSLVEHTCSDYTAPDGQVYMTSGMYTAVVANAAGCDSIIMIDLTVGMPTMSSIVEMACGSYTAPDGQVYMASGMYTAVIPNMMNCDSTITIDLTITSPSMSSIMETACDHYTAPDGQMHMASGTYTAVIPNMMGCDSTITIDLTINMGTSSSMSDVICQSYTAPDGMVYTMPGTYMAVIPNMIGCDSTITLTLTTNNTTSSTVEATTCAPYTAPDGQVYNLSGTYTAIIPNAMGCDSIITINLSTSNTTSSIMEQACSSYTAPDGQVYTQSGMYTAIIPNAVACDSVIMIDLTINNTMSSIVEMACSSYTAPDGQVYMASGMYTAVIPNMMGCDSTISIDLTINMPTMSSITESVCGSYTAPDGQVYLASGLYTAVIPNMMSCDSIITIDLTITPGSSSSLTESVCQTYTAPDGQVYTQSGTYTAVLTGSDGCDSTITIDLTILPALTRTMTTTSCGAYTAPDGQVYNASGTYLATLPNTTGCDSIITINLTVKQSTTATVNKTQCGSYIGPDGQEYTQSGVYTVTIPNATGCDSVITMTLNLSIVNTSVLPTSTGLTAIADASGFQWVNCNNNFQALAGETNQSYTVTQAGNYAVIVSEAGCSDTSECFIMGNVSLEDITNESEVKVYPNPTSDQLNIVFNNKDGYEIQVMDLNGKVMMKAQTTLQETTLELKDLPTGIYILEMSDQTQKITQRVTKL